VTADTVRTSPFGGANAADDGERTRSRRRIDNEPTDEPSSNHGARGSRREDTDHETMSRSRPHSRLTTHRGAYVGPQPIPRDLTWRSIAILGALPVTALAVALYPLAAAFVLATLSGAVAGAALQRRRPEIPARMVPDREPPADRERSGTAPR